MKIPEKVPAGEGSAVEEREDAINSLIDCVTEMQRGIKNLNENQQWLLGHKHWQFGMEHETGEARQGNVWGSDLKAAGKPKEQGHTCGECERYGTTGEICCFQRPACERFTPKKPPSEPRWPEKRCKDCHNFDENNCQHPRCESEDIRGCFTPKKERTCEECGEFEDCFRAVASTRPAARFTCFTPKKPPTPLNCGECSFQGSCFENYGFAECLERLGKPSNEEEG